MKTVSLRIPDKLNEILEKVAYQQERSKSFVFKKALQLYLEDLEDLDIAEAAYKSYLNDGKKSVSIEELADELGIKLRKI